MTVMNTHFADTRSVVEQLQPCSPVYCLRPAELTRSAELFLRNFPGRVLYAVKCNPNPRVLQVLHDAGVRHFDTASLNEIEVVRRNFPDSEAYFMHPVKARSAIRSAWQAHNVDHWVIDHESEFDKMIQSGLNGHEHTILVRLRTRPFGAAFELSDKFGIAPEDAPALLGRVADAGFRTGLAFHVGSQCRKPEAFRDAIRVVGEVLRKARVDIRFLDVGGGFPVHYVDDRPPPLLTFIEAIKNALAQIPLSRDCVLMCEPGRAMVANGCSLLTQVQLRKGMALYINDGVYHSLSEPLSAGIRFPFRPLRRGGEFADPPARFRVYGPTCDSTDVLPYEIALPADIGEGDWIEFGQMGAYSNAMTSRFNGFFPDTYVTIDEPPLAPR